MSGGLQFLFLFICVVQVVAFGVALIARWWPVELEPLTMRGIDVERATELLAVYLESVHDHRFAFPTGVFRAERVGAGEVVVREANFAGSAGLRLVRFALALPALGMAIGAEEGAAAAMFGLFLGLMAAMMLAVPIVAVALIDIVLRALMRSRIRATVAVHPQHDDGVLVHLRLIGLSAFGVEHALRAGLAAPELPARLRPGGAVAPVAPMRGHDRLRLVYAGAGAVAALVALVLVVAHPSGTSGVSPSFSDVPSAADADAPATSSEEPPVDDAPATTSEEPPGEDASTPATPATKRFDRGAFSLRLPADWTAGARDVDHGGVFVESRWHPAGDRDVTLLVDYTAGYSGTAASGAKGVRNQARRAPTYREIAFGPVVLSGGTRAWRWEFVLGGEHKIDWFLTGCDTGYALLGEASPGAFGHYRDTFVAAAASLTPTC